MFLDSDQADIATLELMAAASVASANVLAAA